MPSLQDYLDAQLQFEKTCHDAIYKWTVKRSGFSEGTADLEILDLSVDGATFSQILAERMKIKRLVITSRTGAKTQEIVPLIPEGSEITVEKAEIDISGNSFETLIDLGKFDLIILKEMLYEVKDLKGFFTAVQSCLKSTTESRIFAVARPKNPPVPLPDPAMAQWRKMTPSREEIIVAAEAVWFIFFSNSAGTQLSN